MFIRLLRNQSLSRAEAARQLGLTRAAASLIADELLHDGIIREMNPTATQQLGRTPVPLTLCPQSGYAIGVYLNREGCTAGLIDICGAVHSQRELKLDQDDDKIETLTACIREMIEQSDIPTEKIFGIGISAPGPVDGESGRILNPPNFSLWHQTDVSPVLSERLGLRVYLENNASCLACYHMGKQEAMGSEDFLLLLVDSGVGSGVVSHGKILKGAGYFSCELGHTSIDYNGRPCDCGNVGCLEMYASMPNLLRDSPYESWKQIMDASKNDEEAAKLLSKETDYLAAGIINMTNMVSIDTVLLAGDLLYCVGATAKMLEEKVNSRTLRRGILPIRVLAARSGPDSKIQAAADVVFNRYLTV